MMNRPLVLIEPAAGNVANGHYMEKLELWVRGAREAGYEPIVMGWDPAPDSLGVGWRSMDRGIFPLLLRLFPDHRRVLFIETMVYAAGLRLARKHACPVIGLTACSPITVAAGALMQLRSVHGFGQILMYSGLHQAADGSMKLRGMCARALALIQKRGGVLLPNAPSAVESLGQSPWIGSRIAYLPDPIEVPVVPEVEIIGKSNASPKLLVAGKDDHRRTPLEHFAKLGGLDRFSSLWLQYPEPKPPALSDGTPWQAPPGLDYEFHNSYLDRDQLIALFRCAKFSAVIYAPSFIQGSGHLAFSVSCGTPVLASDFPYARDMFGRFGLLGEQFTYHDRGSFLAAIDRLLAWGPREYEEFIAARRAMLAEVNHEAVVKKALEFVSQQVP